MVCVLTELKFDIVHDVVCVCGDNVSSHMQLWCVVYAHNVGVYKCCCMCVGLVLVWLLYDDCVWCVLFVFGVGCWCAYDVLILVCGCVCVGCCV